MSEIDLLNHTNGMPKTLDSEGMYRRSYTPWWAVGLTTAIIAIFVYFLFWLFKNCMSEYD